MTRWIVGDRIVFDAGHRDYHELHKGTVREVTVTLGRDTAYGITWDDGFEDGAGNILAECELDDPEDE